LLHNNLLFIIQVHIYFGRGGDVMRTNPKKKIIMDSNSNFWVFHHNTSKMIRYTAQQDRDETMENEVDVGERVEEFDLDIDSGDNIHLVAVSSGKNVIYCRYDRKEWVKNVLYNFSKTETRISNLKIISIGNELHLLYVITVPSGNGALFHHHWSGTEWVGYKVIDLPDKDKWVKYDAVSSNHHGIYLILWQSGKLSLWEFSSKQWEKKNDNICEKISNINTIIFQRDNVVIGDKQAVYFAQNIFRDGGEMFTVLVNSNSIAEGPVVINTKKALYTAWVVENRLYYRASYDGGGSWGKVKVYYHLQGKELETYKFSSNYAPFSNVKRVIGTKMPQLHIPFIHRPNEQIKLSERKLFPDSQVKIKTQDSGTDELIKRIQMLESRQAKIIENFNWFDNIKSLEKNIEQGMKELRTELTSLKERINTDGIKQSETVLKNFKEKIDLDIKEVKTEVSSLKEKIDLDKYKKLEALLQDLENVKQRLPQVPGNVMTQNTINKYLKNKR